jgi:hypothetical protein
LQEVLLSALSHDWQNPQKEIEAMKKLFALVAAVGLSVSLMGCAGEPAATPPADTPAETTPPADTPAEVTPPADTPAEVTPPADTPAETPNP